MERNKDKEYVLFGKINMFGERYVGKSYLIALMEKYGSNI